MGLICLGSLWVLLRPGSDYSAVSYLEPALYDCDFGGSTHLNSDGVEQALTAERRLDVGRGGWTLTGQDSDWGTLEAQSGSLTYDAEADILEIQADAAGARISGLSALRLREGTTLAVEYVSTPKDGGSADRVKVEVQFKKEETAASLSSDFPEWDLPDTGMPFATLKCTSRP